MDANGLSLRTFIAQSVGGEGQVRGNLETMCNRCIWYICHRKGEVETWVKGVK